MDKPSRLPPSGITVGDIPGVGGHTDAILAEFGLLEKTRTSCLRD